jgi:putative addiction module component (TIGR02574 family)
MEINEIVQEVLRLPATARFEIVDQILQSLDKPDPEIDRIWGEEAVNRLAAYDAGRSKTYSMDEVLGKD